MKNTQLIKKLIPVLLMLMSLSACKSPSQRADEHRLETEIAMISNAVRETDRVTWTDTPAPTATPTEKPTKTPAGEVPAVPTQTEAPEILIVPASTGIPVQPTVEPEHFKTSTPGPGAPTPDTRMAAKDWRDWPIVPEISDNAADIYRFGVERRGNNPHYLSRIGDCHSEPDVFMGIYDTGAYQLPEGEEYLENAINYFRGSFYTISYAVHSGMSPSSVLTNLWADPSVCLPRESSLNCEIRLNNPSVMFVNLGSNWIQGVSMDIYYQYLAEIVRTLIDRGILPILTSKADNVEGDNKINEVTAQVALDYDIPYYNFWRVAQTLPDGGLDMARDGIHLSMDAWGIRSYYALKVLYAVGEKLNLF